ncbi:TldD/PmbA family protein, partial [Candidatus Micrarchaeota archaeon]|nr:TldD/PmbA family protein [Candidatus Micrarchaeota archaeon]
RSAFSVRVLNHGAFGFASTNDERKLGEACERAVRLCKAAGKKSLDTTMSAEKTSVDKITLKAKKPVADVSLEEKVKRAVELNKLLSIKKVIGFDTAYSDAHFSHFYASSEGARIEFESDSSGVFHSVFAKKSGAIIKCFEGFSGLYGFELTDDVLGRTREVAKRCVSLLDAKRVNPGTYDVVLGPKMAGTLAHEAVGHACEADYVLMGESILRGKMNERIGSRFVNISDDPTLERHAGSYYYDDEGVKSRKTRIIENGVLRSYLHSRETAGKMNTTSTGNARSQGVSRFPLVRMSNTVVEPGEFSFDDITDIRRGFYVEGVKGGQVMTSAGTYQFASEGGFAIENGELKERVRDVVIIGDILGTLNKVDAVGKELAFNDPGTCGKGGQGVPVSGSAPCVRIRGVRVA